MTLFPEIELAIDEELENINESDSFKRGFKRLIENFIEKSYREDDIKEVINLIQLKRDGNYES